MQSYKEPCLTTLNSSDTCSNVKKLSSGTVVWKHVGGGEGEVRNWYAGIGAEAKDGRVLFNLHYKDAWEALFHEPVHEAAPSGGVGTSPRWTYEGYCEIFAKQLAARMGHTNYNIESGPYGAYAREVQKLIDFTSETYVARAYFLNGEWAYGLLAPLWYRRVAGHDLSVDISQYIPTDLTEVPGQIESLIKRVPRNPKPEWYKRWVRIFGRRDPMPTLATNTGARVLDFPNPVHCPSRVALICRCPRREGTRQLSRRQLILRLIDTLALLGRLIGRARRSIRLDQSAERPRLWSQRARGPILPRGNKITSAVLRRSATAGNGTWAERHQNGAQFSPGAIYFGRRTK